MTRKSRRQRLSAWEWDAVSKYARSIICAFQKSGKAKWLKRQMNRRWRRGYNKDIKEDMDQ